MTSSEHTAREAEDRLDMKMAKLATANAPGTFWHTFVENTEHLLKRNALLEGQLAKARELSAAWLRNAENVRGSADRLPGLSKVEKAELKQGAIELEHCAHQLRNTLGPCEGDSDD